jgi:class 3 adenylate cyclase/predicted ATPase
MSGHADIERAIEALETQRAVLGDSVVDEAIGALLAKLSAQQDDYSRTEEQRKLVTILFCDLVGFTSLSETMDPEAIREILNMFFSPWYTVISRYNGKIEKFIGDAVMAVFGIPVASEGDPERAIRAALDAREMLVHQNDELESKFGIRLGYRIGINTGNVLVGELGREGEFTVTGDSVNLASRIQGAAPENGILISHNTYRHVRGIFDVEPLPDITVKGKSEAVVVYEIKQAKPRSFRIATRGVEGLETRTIGREKEFTCLEEAWLTVSRDGEARFAIITGEAGIGKSRLLYDFRNWMELRPEHFWLFQGRASSETRNQPYSLIRDLISFRFQISEVDDGETRRSKLEQGISDFLGEDQQREEIAHFIGQLIGFDFSDSPYIRGILHDPGQIRDRAAHALTRFLAAATGTDPVVILIEDIQWADQGSLSILNTIGLQLLEKRILIVSTARPEFFKRSSGMEFFTVSTEEIDTPSRIVEIKLKTLSDKNTRALLHDILRLAEGVPEKLLNRIVERSEGNPYYIEEFVKILIDEGAIVKGEKRWWIASARLEHVSIPPTLTGLLQARLDKLPIVERDVLQRASVVGRVFWNGIVVDLLAGSASADRDVNGTLESLCNRELIRKREDTAFSGNAEYIFHHALLHEVTYESVLKKYRRMYHGMIGRWFIDQSEMNAQRHSGIIAEHFDRAGDGNTAASWYVRAAKYAMDRYANDESLQYVNRSMELISEENPRVRYDAIIIRIALNDRLGRRDAQRSDIETLGQLARELNDTRCLAEMNLKEMRLGITIGDYSMAAEEAERATAVAQEERYIDLEAQALQGWGETLWRKGDLQESRRILLKAKALGQKISSSEIEAGALRNLGAVSLYMGEHEQARSYFEDSLKIFQKAGDRAAEGATLNNLGLALYHAGNINKARDVYEKAYTVFRMIGHRHGESSILINLGMVANQQEDFGSALRYYSDALSISRAIKHRSNELLALNNIGFILASLGNHDAALRCYGQAFAISATLNEKHPGYTVATNLAYLRLRMGDFDGARKLYTTNLRSAEDLGDRSAHIEAQINMGHTYLEQGERDKAESEYRKAMAILNTQELSTLPAELIYGLMKTANLRGEGNRAIELAEELLSRLPSIGFSDSLEPIRLYLGCYEVFGSHNDARAGDVLKEAMDRLHAAAETIDDSDLRRSFFKNVTFNKAIITAWQQITQMTKD